MQFPDYPFAPTLRCARHRHVVPDEGERRQLIVMLHGVRRGASTGGTWSTGWKDRYRCIVPDHVGMG
jgi:haloalkane dehalogenase